MTTLRFNGNTADERGITHGDKNHVGRWYLVQNFTGDRGGACGNERIAGIVEKIMAVVTREFCGTFAGGSLTYRASLHDFAAERDNSCTLYRVRFLRQKNRGADLRDARGIGNRSPVVTSTSRDNSWQWALRRGCEQSVERSSRLKRTGWQIALDFQINSRA